MLTLSPCCKFKGDGQGDGWKHQTRVQALCKGSGGRHLLPESGSEHFSLVPTLTSVNYCQWQQRFLSSDTLGGIAFCSFLWLQSESQSMRTSETFCETYDKANRNYCGPWAPEMKCPNGSSLMAILNKKSNSGGKSWCRRHSSSGI